MPLPLLLGAGLLAAGGAVASGAIGALSQASANDTNIQLQREAFDENERMWHLQNEYNSPVAQMQRLQEAGLNPNLVYGSGSVAGNQSGSVPQMQAAHVSPVTNGNFMADALSKALFTQAQLESVQEQTELSRTQQSVQQQQVLESAARTAEAYMRTARSEFDLGLAKDLRDYTLEAQKANVEHTWAEVARSNYSAMMQQAELQLMPLRERMSEAQINQIKAAINEVSIRASRENWDLTQLKNGKLAGNDIWSQLFNQVIRAQNGEDSVFDGVYDKNGNGAFWPLVDSIGKYLFGRWW